METLPTIYSHTYRQKPFRSFIMKEKDFRVRQSGFTLLELLAVVVIIGIVISIASLSIGQKNSHVVQDEAERLNGLLRLASEEAVMQGRELALEFSGEAYSFLELGTDNQWHLIGDDELLRDRSFPTNINIDLVVEGAQVSFDDKENLPRIFVLSSGELTPFTLTLSLDEEESYILDGAIDGKLTLTKATENELDA